MQNVIRKLIYICNNSESNNTSKQIAQKLISNLFCVSDMNIQEISELCYTSTATFNRFFKSLGYINYHEFLSSLKNTIMEYRYLSDNAPSFTSHNQIDSFFNIFSESFDNFKNVDRDMISTVSDQIYKSEQISFYSTFEGSITAFQQDLIITGKKANLLVDPKLQFDDAQHMGSKSMIVMLDCKLKDNFATMEAYKIGKSKGATCTAIISNKTPSKTIYNNSDYILSFQGSNSEIDLYLFELYIHLLDLDYRNKYLNINS